MGFTHDNMIVMAVKRIRKTVTSNLGEVMKNEVVPNSANPGKRKKTSLVIGLLAINNFCLFGTNITTDCGHWSFKSLPGMGYRNYSSREGKQ
jgi:hypothetical protein